jgi:hypothetical protein
VLSGEGAVASLEFGQRKDCLQDRSHVAAEGGALGYEAESSICHVFTPVSQVCEAGQARAKDGFECFSVVADEREVIGQVLLNLLSQKAN